MKNNTGIIETDGNQVNRWNIMKEVRESNLKLSLLKLDLSKLPDEIITKTLNFITKKLNSEDLEIGIMKYTLVNMLLFDAKTVSNMRKSEGLNLTLGKSVSYDDYLEFEKKNDEFAHDMRYFDMSGKLPTGKNGSGYTWQDKSRGRFTVYNGKKLVAISKLCDELLKHLPPFDVDRYKEYLVKRFFYNNKWQNSSDMNDEIVGIILTIYQDDLSIQSMREYEKTQNSDYALSFMTKKNIKTNTMMKMESNAFLGNGFAFVEVDNDTDLTKFEAVEKEWAGIYNFLPKVDSKNADLRFRKLGNHNATGLYYPAQNCLCVDIRDVSSMLHEYGHLIDYLMYDGILSLSEDFRGIVLSYAKEIDGLPEDSYVVKKKKYYATPTEIFARAFELYLNKRVESSLLKQKDHYATDYAYTCFNEEARNELEAFFCRVLGEVKI